MDTTTKQIENRLSKERIRFLQTGAQTDGELFAFEVWVPTDMIPPPPICTSPKKNVWRCSKGR